MPPNRTPRSDAYPTLARRIRPVLMTLAAISARLDLDQWAMDQWDVVSSIPETPSWDGIEWLFYQPPVGTAP